jgi:release factor glutamine methyltransferase
MRTYFKYLSSLVLVPLTQWYLRKERIFTYDKFSIVVFPGVFHPGLFHSTKFLLSYLESLKLKDKKFLELGCGSGLISIYAAHEGAEVTASDISKRAVENALVNATRNNVRINAFHSDLFTSHPSQRYDYIVINPPYYAKNPTNESEYAWYCGEGFNYFELLFTQLPSFIEPSSEIVMVLTSGCDLDTISSIARKNNFEFEMLRERNSLFDGKDFLYRIKTIN